MTRIQKLILEALRNILFTGPSNPYLGICNAVNEYLFDKHEIVCDAELDDELTRATETWPDKSDSEAYPVGSWTIRPSNLFWHHCDNQKSMWDPETRYGKARLALLNHLIDYFQKLENQ